MGLIFSCISACCLACSTCQSCLACLGRVSQNDNNVSDVITVTSGRKRSVLLVIFALIIALIFRYTVASALSSQSAYIVTYFPGGERLYNAWMDDCDFSSGANTDEGLYAYVEICREHSGVYRAGFCSFVFFVLATGASWFSPYANRSGWLIKYVVFFLACWGSMYVNNGPLFNDVYLNLARIGATLFIVLQQVILIDMAYNWNDYWVVMSNHAEREDGPGAGNKYLAGLLSASVMIYAVVLICIGVLFHVFGVCDTNEAFISITLVGVVIMTGVQLSGEEGSLLTSAVISGYSVYLAFTSMTKNPDTNCNPLLGKNDTIGIVIGIGITVLSMAWVGYSLTAEERLTSKGASATETLLDGRNKDNYQSTESGTQQQPVQGVILNSTNDDDKEENISESNLNTQEYSAHWKLNIVLLLLTCWFSVSLTSWGTIESGGSAANPDTGRVAMWMIISSQWLVTVLYIWTLVAPRLYPDRDFS